MSQFSANAADFRSTPDLTRVARPHLRPEALFYACIAAKNFLQSVARLSNCATTTCAENRAPGVMQIIHALHEPARILLKRQPHLRNFPELPKNITADHATSV